jgi:4-hydroxy-tetrahydrodipicolinate synthase
MARSLFHGLIAELATPFRDDEIDETALAALIERQIAAGIDGLAPAGAIGEAATLSGEEHHRIVKLCVEVARGRVPVLAGAGSNATSRAIELVQQAKAAGADGALVIAPFYNRPSQAGIYQHYAALTQAVDLPIILHNSPARTGVDIAPETAAALAKLPSIVGIVDATGDVSRVSLGRMGCGADWTMLSGDEGSALGHFAHGGNGWLSATANVAPIACAAFQEACVAEDWPLARWWQNRLIHLDKALSGDGSPSAIKFALAHLGLCQPSCRLPIGDCPDALKPSILAAMRGANVAG